MVRSLNVRRFVTVCSSRSERVRDFARVLRLCRGSCQQQSVHEDPAAAQHAEEAQEASAQRVLHRRLRGDRRRYQKRRFPQPEDPKQKR